MPQSAVDIRFHVEHIIARQHRLDDSLANLALACDRCNFLKGPNIASTDDDGTMTRLFDPRRDDWHEHFCLVGAEIIGITPVGRDGEAARDERAAAVPVTRLAARRGHLVRRESTRRRRVRLRRLPVHERMAILRAQAAIAEELYRRDPELTSFEAFGEEDLYGDSSGAAER